MALAVYAVAASAGRGAEAQTATATTGAVNGVVTDTTGALLPQVRVSLSGPSVIAPLTTLTDVAGAYALSAVPTGDHILTFELTGFGPVVRDGIHVGIGFTATVDVVMSPGSVNDSVTVSGASPVVDLAATGVTTRFDSATLASLPGSRDFFALVANTPGVALAKTDVGGSNALSTQEYTAYGLRAITGMHRVDVEGIRVGGANGANDNYFADFASFSEIAIQAVGHTAAMPVPGTLAQYVGKAGGNVYHGSGYADYQGEALESTNIDDGQLARGVTGGPGLDAREVNRLQRFRDFNADVGGYLKKDVAWWYGAYRSSAVAKRYPWLLDTPAELVATVATGKATYVVARRHRVVGYLQHSRFTQSSYFNAGTSQPIQTSDALPSFVFPARVWKGEYSAALTDRLYVEGRVGAYLSTATGTSKTTAPRIADIGANTISGGALTQGRSIDRPQANGSLSYLKNGWGGNHTFRVGGEYMSDRVVTPVDGYGGPCNCVSTLNNGVPTQVTLLLGANVSKNDLTTAAAYVDDTWRVGRRITLSVGLRLDRYQPALPAQEGPAGQTFAAVAPVLTLDNWGPRAGISLDVTGDGKTVVKAHYGRYWLYPAPLFTAALNPNPAGWSRTYLWATDPNANGRWDDGEQGRLIAVSGGSTSTRLDPDIRNSSVDQTTVYVEREVAPYFGVRTGVVLNARRLGYGTINVSRPLDAYAVPVPAPDPGPDGRLGSSDDGAVLTAYGLDADTLAAAPVNLLTNLAGTDSDYTTWEITATKRQSAGWALLASFTHTWNREAALAPGADFTPNALINAAGGQDRFRTWQAKLNATVGLPHGFRLVPVVRHQSGQPFARTFVPTLNYGNATIKAEPISANRTPDITLVDVRTEKAVALKGVQILGFFDVYNLFNTNAEQTLTTSSGGAWLRPTAITGPRVARIGARLDW